MGLEQGQGQKDAEVFLREKRKETMMGAMERVAGRGGIPALAMLLGSIVLFLPGCAPPPLVAERAYRPPVAEQESRAPAEERREAPPPRESPAVAGLLASARQAAGAGQFGRAEMSLERALRLEPRNGRLWHEMAQVKYGGKNYGQAVQFALKANSLAGRDTSLLRRNWLLLEKAYLQQGRPDKAREAGEKARALP